MTEQQKIISELCRLEIIRVSFSQSYKKDNDVKKIVIKPVMIRQTLMYQIESFTQKQAFHNNITMGDLESKIDEILQNTFRQAQIFTPDYIYSLKISSKGKLLHNRTKNINFIKSDNTQTNNRKKNYIIDIENLPDIFRELGVSGADGKIINSKYDKFRQICRFCEIINDAVKNDTRENFNIVDFGCGKSYLTFVVHHYFTRILGKKVNIVGLDLKADVIKNCNALCEKYGIQDINFLCMDVKDYVPKTKVDMVIALHACDIATDFALYNAYLWQSDYIFSAPCCQHEMNAVMKSKSFGLLNEFGLLKERFCSLATDAIRCKLLQMCGYSTDTLEFVDAENSPKNLLIRAIRRTKNTYRDIVKIHKEIDTFNSEFTSPLCFERLLKQDFYEYSVQNFPLVAIAGKASMLVRDNVALRNEVFGKEQGDTAWACRDDADNDALFVNIYSQNTLAGACRMTWIDRQDGSVLFGRIAVKETFRGLGLGRDMLEILQKKAKALGANTAYIYAKPSAIGFYQAIGFVKTDAEPCENETICVYKAL